MGKGGDGGDASAEFEISSGWAYQNQPITVLSKGGQGGFANSGLHGKGGSAQTLVKVGRLSDPFVAEAITTSAQGAEVRAKAGTPSTPLPTTIFARTTEAQGLVSLKEAAERQAVAAGTLLPAADELSSLLAGLTTVPAAFADHKQVLGYGVMGSMATAATPALTYNLAVEYNFPKASLALDKPILLGLLGTHANLPAFEQLTFTVLADTHTLLSRTFLAAEEAFDFFNDAVVDLGFWTADQSSNHSLIFLASITGSPGAEFSFNFIWGQTCPASAVPLPPSILLLGIALIRTYFKTASRQ